MVDISYSKRYTDPSLAALYAEVRPLPPPDLAATITDYLKEGYSGHLDHAVDIGCGSGQTTRILSPYFNKVTGVDISLAQITEGEKSFTNPENLNFVEGSAEKLPFEDSSVQLVTSGTASHWFDLPKFYKEVDRVLAPGGVVALYGYSDTTLESENLEKTDAVQKILHSISTGELKKYIPERNSAIRNSANAKSSLKYPSPMKNIDLPYAETKGDESQFYQWSSGCAGISLPCFLKLCSSICAYRLYKEANGEAAHEKLMNRLEQGMLDIFGGNIDLPLRFRCCMNMGRKPIVTQSQTQLQC